MGNTTGGSWKHPKWRRQPQNGMEKTKLMSLDELRKRFYKKSVDEGEYKHWCPVNRNDPELQMLGMKFMHLFKENGIDTVTDYTDFFDFKDVRQQRAVACMLGLGISDAFGANTEFLHYDKNRRDLILKDFKEIPDKVMERILNRRGPIAVWTDDCSMSLCLADSLLLNEFNLDPLDLRWRFLLWLNCGLNNGGRPYSIGLGGNIAVSFEEFWKDPTKPYAEKGDGFNNGNGSLMRMAPSVTAFVDDKKKAIEISEKQSWTTHNGEQASECCKLFAQILWTLINRDDKKDPNPKELLLKVCDSFQSRLPTVQCLAKGQMEPQELFNKQDETNPKFKKFNKSPELDRNWNWRTKDFTYSDTRNKDQPGYIGSYCMDALAMALFLAYHTDSFYEAALWATNMGGDSDTVGAICGQITGAMYGLSKQMLTLYSQMPDCFSGRLHLFIVASKLARHEAIKQK